MSDLRGDDLLDNDAISNSAVSSGVSIHPVIEL